MSGYDLVRIENRSRGTVVAERCRVARGMFRRIFGLHLLPQLEPGDGLLLRGATTIDMMFMRYPIDAVFVDAAARVVRVVPELRPWRMVLPVRGARDCIELPAGAADRSATREGDQLAFAGRSSSEGRPAR